MELRRQDVLQVLSEVSIGLSDKEMVEQSNCFCFQGGRLYTFNDEILATAKSPLDIEGAVQAKDFLGLLSCLPDDLIDVSVVGEELVVAAKHKKAGLSFVREVRLPFDSVSSDVTRWSPMSEQQIILLQQASRTCGADETAHLSTVVHVTPDRIEACDGFRLFHFKGQTPFKSDVLLPATSLSSILTRKIDGVSVGEGWTYWKTSSGAMIAARCFFEPYHDKIDGLLVMPGAETVKLPAALVEMLTRANVMCESGYSSRVLVEIRPGRLTLTSRKVGGWYKERGRIDYVGRELTFEAHSDFLIELLGRTRVAQVTPSKMKVVSEGVQFVVSLVPRSEVDED